MMNFQRALCTDYPENLWLSADAADQVEARKICRQCPVILQCYILMREVKPSCGVWAGEVIGHYLEEVQDERKKTPAAVG